MTNKRTVKITIQQRETITVAGMPLPISLWCPDCQSEVSMASGEQSAKLAGLSCRELYRRVEEGLLHFVESSDGLLFVCLNSLLPDGYREGIGEYQN